MTIKKFGKRLIMVVLGVALLLGCVPSRISASEIEMQSLSMDKKAVWISYLDFGTLRNKSESVFRSNVNTIYQNVVNQGLDTVIVHVRLLATPFIHPNIILGQVLCRPVKMDWVTIH